MVLRNAFAEIGSTKTPSGADLIGNARTKFRDGFASPGAQPDPAVWTLLNDAPASATTEGHIVQQGGDSFGSSYLRVSMSPFIDASEVSLTSKDTFRMPTRIGFGISQSQRVVGQECFLGMVEDDGAGFIRKTTAQPSDKPITGGGTVATNVLSLTVPGHGFRSGDRVMVVGCADTRMNVGPVVVTVTGDDTLTVPATIANATYVVTGGYVRHVDPLSRADNGGGLLLETATTTTATLATRRNRAKYRLRASTVASTAAVQGTAAAFADAFLSTGVHEMYATMDEFAFRSFAADGNSTLSGGDKFNQSVPDEELSYRLHVRMRNLVGLSMPVAQIVSAAKSGTTTATITTDRAHNLTTSSRVGIYGIRDQANFANLSDMAVASIVNATTFTVVFGTSATVTDTLGGFVIINHGQVNSPGAFNVALSTIARDAAGVVTVVTNASAAPLPGEFVHLWGINAVGVESFDGAYKVLSASTTTLLLEPVFGRTVGAAVAATPTGGGVIRRTEHRLHLVRALDHTRILTEVVGGRGGITDGNNAVPVSITTAASLNFGTAVPIGVETTESSTTLAASALYSGAVRDLGTDRARMSTRIRASVRHAAGLTPGSLYLEQSLDNVTFFETWRTPVPSDGYVHTFEVPAMFRYLRWRFQNGATAQTGFTFQTIRTTAEGPMIETRVLAFPLSTTALAAAASFSGPVLDLGGSHSWDEVRAAAFADVAGTMFIDHSRDGTVFRTEGAGVAVAANSYVTMTQPVNVRYVRPRFVNGATAQGAFAFDSTLLAR